MEAAVGSKKIKREIVITDKDLQDTRERLCNEPGTIDFAMFGCPHITIRQVGIIAVSYTHLDVYKRQLSGRAGEARGYSPVLCRGCGKRAAW